MLQCFLLSLLQLLSHSNYSRTRFFSCSMVLRQQEYFPIAWLSYVDIIIMCRLYDILVFYRYQSGFFHARSISSASSRQFGQQITISYVSSSYDHIVFAMIFWQLIQDYITSTIVFVILTLCLKVRHRKSPIYK
jgi:hypothetical protein